MLQVSASNYISGGFSKFFGDPKKSGHPVVNKARQAACMHGYGSSASFVGCREPADLFHQGQPQRNDGLKILGWPAARQR
jgi:hypothetical protein